MFNMLKRRGWKLHKKQDISFNNDESNLKKNQIKFLKKEPNKISNMKNIKTEYKLIGCV